MDTMGGLNSKKSPTGPTEWTPKPENLIARSQLTKVRSVGIRSHSVFDGLILVDKALLRAYQLPLSFNIALLTHHGGE